MTLPPSPPSPACAGGGEADLFERLDADVRSELATAYAPRSKGPLGTAVRSLARFAKCVPRRQLFKRPRVRGDLAVEAYNEWTLLLWAQQLSGTVSAKTGRYLKAKSIEQRISLTKGLLSFRYGFQLAGEAPRLKRFLAQKRSRDPAANLRKKRRGMRRHHLQRVWRERAGVRGTDRASLSEWAAVTSAWHMLARGGELYGVTKGDLEFKVSKRTGRKYAILWLQPLKKRRGEAEPKLPQFIQEQVEPADWEPYRALARLAQALQHEPASTPLFTGAKGQRMTTARFRALIKRYAGYLGWDRKEAGAHSPRIGGAAEYAASGEVSELLLQARGRWSSDIARIYARMTRRAHLAASDLMFNARGRDLEELIPEYVEPA